MSNEHNEQDQQMDEQRNGWDGQMVRELAALTPEQAEAAKRPAHDLMRLPTTPDSGERGGEQQARSWGKWYGERLPLDTASLVSWMRAKWHFDHNEGTKYDPATGAFEDNPLNGEQVWTLDPLHLGAFDVLAVRLVRAGAYPEGIHKLAAKLPEGSEAVFAMRATFARNVIQNRLMEIAANSSPSAGSMTTQIVQIGAGLDPLGLQLELERRLRARAGGAPLAEFRMFIVDQPAQLRVREQAMRHFAVCARAQLQPVELADEMEDWIWTDELATATHRDGTKVRTDGLPDRYIPLTITEQHHSVSLGSELVNGLRAAGWSDRFPTIFVMMGVSYYMSASQMRAILASLSLINELRAPLLRDMSALPNLLIMDYAQPPSMSGGEDAHAEQEARAKMAAAEQALKDAGEPIKFKTDEITPLLVHYGLTTVHDTSFLSFYTQELEDAAEIKRHDPRRLRFVVASYPVPRVKPRTSHLY